MAKKKMPPQLLEYFKNKKNGDKIFTINISEKKTVIIILLKKNFLETKDLISILGSFEDAANASPRFFF